MDKNVKLMTLATLPVVVVVVVVVGVVLVVVVVVVVLVGCCHLKFLDVLENDQSQRTHTTAEIRFPNKPNFYEYKFKN